MSAKTSCSQLIGLNCMTDNCNFFNLPYEMFNSTDFNIYNFTARQILPEFQNIFLSTFSNHDFNSNNDKVIFLTKLKKKDWSKNMESLHKNCQEQIRSYRINIQLKISSYIIIISRNWSILDYFSNRRKSVSNDLRKLIKTNHNLASKTVSKLITFLTFVRRVHRLINSRSKTR